MVFGCGFLPLPNNKYPVVYFFFFFAVVTSCTYLTRASVEHYVCASEVPKWDDVDCNTTSAAGYIIGSACLGKMVWWLVYFVSQWQGPLLNTTSALQKCPSEVFSTATLRLRQEASLKAHVLGNILGMNSHVLCYFFVLVGLASSAGNIHLVWFVIYGHSLWLISLKFIQTNGTLALISM